jgi:hypothetical protein
MCCCFPQTMAGLSCRTQDRSALHSDLPPLDRGENFPLFIRPPVLSRRDALSPQTVLDCDCHQSRSWGMRRVVISLMVSGLSLDWAGRQPSEVFVPVNFGGSRAT